MKDLASNNVNQCYEMYRKDKRAYPRVKEAVDMYVYQYPLLVSRQYEEICGDFWSAMAHKIPNYIKNFVYKSIPFERYLCVTVKFQFITFLQKFIRETRELRMYNNHHALFSVAPWTSMEYETPEYTLECLVCFIHQYFRTHTVHERLWWFILHYSPMFPIQRIIKMGNCLGIRDNEIKRILVALANDMQKQTIRLDVLRAQCNMCFAQRNILDRELEEDVLVIEERLYLCERRERYNKRYHKLLRQLQGTMASISHARLSEVIKVPKGTIDCGMSLLRRQCAKFKTNFYKKGTL